jgi:hypothetical protein
MAPIHDKRRDCENQFLHLGSSVVIRQLTQLVTVDGYPHIELARIPVSVLLNGSSRAALLERG